MHGQENVKTDIIVQKEEMSIPLLRRELNSSIANDCWPVTSAPVFTL